MWLWCDRERARGKFSVTAACAFGEIPRLRGPPHLHCVHSCGIKEPVRSPLMLLLHTASSHAWRLRRNSYVRKCRMQKYNSNSDQRVLIPYFRSTPTCYNLAMQTLMMWCAKPIDRKWSRWCKIEKISNNFYKTYVRITFLKSLTRMHTFVNPGQPKAPH